MSWLEIATRAAVMFIGFWIAIQSIERFSWACSKNQFITRLSKFNDFIFGIIQISIGLIVMLAGLFINR